jgi:hypothetical protein
VVFFLVWLTTPLGNIWSVVSVPVLSKMHNVVLPQWGTRNGSVPGWGEEGRRREEERGVKNKETTKGKTPNQTSPKQPQTNRIFTYT